MDNIKEGNLRHYCPETESISFWIPGKGSSLGMEEWSGKRMGKEAAFNFIPDLKKNKK